MQNDEIISTAYFELFAARSLMITRVLNASYNSRSKH